MTGGIKGPNGESQDIWALTIANSDKIGVTIISFLLLILGYKFINGIINCKNNHDYMRNDIIKYISRYIIQLIGLAFLLPTILMISVFANLHSEAITALLGSVIGFFFGSVRQPNEEKAEMKNSSDI